MAKKRIAGITIEIGGNTTKLETSLKGVDSQLKTTQEKLRDVDKLLKFDPKNTELLTQKQKGLESAIDATKKRLEQLKSAQTDALSPEEYDALQREIIETEQNLDSLEKEYKDFGSVGKQQIKAVASQVQETGKKITEFGKSWTTHVTAPIAALGGLAYKAFTEVDEGMDIIVKKTGATGETLAGFGEIMKEIANTIPTDFATAGEAVGEVNTRFQLTGEALRDLSEDFIRFAKINDADVTASVDATQKALAAFNLGAEDTGKYLDFLTSEAQRTGANVLNLASGVTSNATALKEMNLSIYDGTRMLADLEVSGADADTVMNGLSKALKNATNEGKPLETALSDLQNTILNGTGSMDGLTAAYDLFGKSGAQVYEAVQSGALDFTNLAGSAELAAGTVTETFNATISPADQFKVAMNNVKTVGAEIAQIVMPALSTALEWVRNVVSDLRDKWNGLTDSQKKTILKIAGVVAAIGPLSTALGGVITLLSGPAGIVVAIGAVVAAGVWLVEHWDDVKKKAEEVWRQITDWFANLGKKAELLWRDVKQFFKDGWQAVSSIDWAGLGRGIWGKVKAAFESVGSWFKDRFDEARRRIKDIDWAGIGTGIWEKITGAWKDIAEWFKTRFTEAKSAIASINWAGVASDIWEKVTGTWKNISDWFRARFAEAWDAITGIDWGGAASSIWNSIIDGLYDIGDWIYGIFDNAWFSIMNIDWGSIASSIWNSVINGLNGIGDWIMDVFRVPVNSVIGLVNGMIGGVEDAFNAVIDGLNTLHFTVGGGSILGVEIPEATIGISNLQHVYWGRIQELANGGMLGEGGRAIVGEYAPEYLTVRNGQAIVTPIQGAKRWGGDTINNTFKIYQQPGESANALAERIARIMTRQQQQRNDAYA